MLNNNNKPPICEWFRHFIPPIKMVMTGGWFMALFYPHWFISNYRQYYITYMYNYICIYIFIPNDC